MQYATLHTALTYYITWSKPGGGPPALTLPQALKITLLYHWPNLIEKLLVQILNISYPTNTIEKALQELISSLVPPLNQFTKYPGSLFIYETLIPTLNCCSIGKTNFSGKHKKIGFNHQVI